MKFIAILLQLIGSVAFAEVGSFESFLNQQSVTTISPVQFEGAPIVARSKKGLLDATMICAALGFDRVVSSSVEFRQFQMGDRVAFLKSVAGGVPVIDIEPVGARKMSVLTSVECAR